MSEGYFLRMLAVKIEQAGYRDLADELLVSSIRVCRMETALNEIAGSAWDVDRAVAFHALLHTEKSRRSRTKRSVASQLHPE